MSEPVLEVINVKTHFPVYAGFLRKRRVGTIKAVDGVSFALQPEEILGIVGESGCGKSTLARTTMQLVRATEGRILVRGREVTAMSRGALRQLRRACQMVFQDPYASLNPRMTVFDAIAEPMLVHGLAHGKELRGRVAELMEVVGLAKRYMRKYPHEFSGGQRQRIAIARTLALEPELIIADEPVSALDVSVQAQILNLLAALRAKAKLSLVLIAHDLSVVKHLARRIAVMYLGRIVEIGDAERVFNNPLHPYTQCLISAIPEPDPEKERARRRIILPGDPPSPLNPPAGCAFHPRCPYAMAQCAVRVPPFFGTKGVQEASCLLLEDGAS